MVDERLKARPIQGHIGLERCDQWNNNIVEIRA
jgi:hypothetical protein